MYTQVGNRQGTAYGLVDDRDEAKEMVEGRYRKFRDRWLKG